MANFNSGKSIFVVLQVQKDGDKEKALSLLQEKAQVLFGLGRYAYILHDKDVLDNGEIKGPHIHIVLTADKARSSNSWIEHFATILQLDRDAVSVEMQGSEKKCIRYLLHLDDANKHQYDRSEVVTNMLDTVKKAWEANNSFVANPTLEQIQEAYKNGSKGLYNLVGLSSFNKALKVVETLHIEDERETYYFEQLEALKDRLCEVTANTEYLKTGSIPLKDYQALLEDVMDTRVRMAKHKAKMDKALAKEKDK